MLLKKLMLTNFKGICETATIPMAPITLLFGGNSSGKSTVLQAYLYLYEILVNNNVNPTKSLAQGDNCLLNGFENMVHGKDLSRTIAIEVELDVSNIILGSYLTDTEEMYISDALNNEQSFEINEPSLESVSIKVELSHAKNGGPYIKQTTVQLNGMPFAVISKESDSKQVWLVLDPLGIEALTDIYGDSSISKLVSDGVGSESFIILDKLSAAIPDEKTRLNVHANSWTDAGDYGDNSLIGKLVLEGVLSQLICGALKVLKKELSKLVHIGPVRDVPIRGYAPNRVPTNWFSGLAGWDKFAFSDEAFKSKVNQWFSSEGFNSKYEFYTEGSYQHVRVKDLSNEIDHEPSELGIGLSQIFPFVVAISDPASTFISIEQPELHIHPGWQLIIADMLIKAIKENPNRTFLVETHSEHIMLRLLNRVRLLEGDAKFSKQLNICSDDLSVINVYADAEGKPFYQSQSVMSNGDFELDWPEGFFEERYGES